MRHMSQVFFTVVLNCTETREAEVEVPVTVDRSQHGWLEDAQKMAYRKAVDAVRSDIELARNIRWLKSKSPSLIQKEKVYLMPEPSVPPEACSLLCSNLLSSVDVPRTSHVCWATFSEKSKGKIIDSIRWLDRQQLPENVAERLKRVKSILKDLSAPDELTRDFDE